MKLKKFMKTTKIKNKGIDYPIFVGAGSINILGKQLKLCCKSAKKIAIIFDKKVPVKYKNIIKKQLKNYKIYIHEYFVNENLKSFERANNLAEKLIQNKFNRNDVLISVGGGVIGDFSGFVASIVKRGIYHVNLPTTLLAQVDASIGGKTGVNSKYGKNLIGSFYSPQLVIIELKFLESLNRRELVCGFAEILKHSLIYDKKFFYWLKKNTRKIIDELNFESLRFAITKSCKIKLHFVSGDIKEKNKRMVLNFGHTFAHAIEAASNFSRRINHGEAVLIGMHLATKLSLKKKICSYSTMNEIQNFYKKNKLPLKLENYFSKRYVSKITQYMSNDKKNTDDKINFILLRNIGRTTKPGEFKLSTNDIKKIFKKII